MILKIEFGDEDLASLAEENGLSIADMVTVLEEIAMDALSDDYGIAEAASGYAERIKEE
jgi:hypothetical protein